MPHQKEYIKNALFRHLYIIVMILFANHMNASSRANWASNKSSGSSRGSTASRTSSSRTSNSRTSSGRTSSRTNSSRSGNRSSRGATIQTNQSTPDVQLQNPILVTNPVIVSGRTTPNTTDTLVTDTNTLDPSQLSNLFIKTKPNITPDQLTIVQTKAPLLNQTMSTAKNFISQKQLVPDTITLSLKTMSNELLATQLVDIFAPRLETTPSALILSGQTNKGNATELLDERNINNPNSYTVQQLAGIIITSRPGISQYQLLELQLKIPAILQDINSIKSLLQQNNSIPTSLQESLKTKLKELLATNLVEIFLLPLITTPVVLSGRTVSNTTDTLVTDINTLDLSQLSDLFIQTKPKITPDQLTIVQTKASLLNQTMSTAKNFISQKQLVPDTIALSLKTMSSELLATQLVDIFAPRLETIASALILSGQANKGNATELLDERNIDNPSSYNVQQLAGIIITSRPGISQYQLLELQLKIPAILQDINSIKSLLQQNNSIPASLQESLKTKLKELLATKLVEIFLLPYIETLTLTATIVTGQNPNAITNFIAVTDQTNLNSLTIDQLSSIVIIAKANISNADLSSIQQAANEINSLSNNVESFKTEPYISNLKTKLQTILASGKVDILVPPVTIQTIDPTQIVATLTAIPAAPPFNVTSIKLLLNSYGLGIVAQQAIPGAGVALLNNITTQQNYLHKVLIENKDDAATLATTTPDIVAKLADIKKWLIEGATNGSLTITIPKEMFDKAVAEPKVTPPSSQVAPIDPVEKAAMIARVNGLNFDAPYNIANIKLILNSDNQGIKVSPRTGLIGNDLIATANTAVSNITYDQTYLNNYFITGKDDATILAGIGQVIWKIKEIQATIVNKITQDLITITAP